MEKRAWKDLAELFDGLPEVQFWIKDAEGRFHACNRAFAATFGLAGEGGIVGRTDFDLAPHHLAREYVADDRTVLSTGRPIKAKMELVRGKDGSLDWYATTKVPLRDDGGRILGTAGFTRRLRGVEDAGTPARGLERAADLIHTRYGEDLAVARLAEAAGMSVDTFERQFRAAFRETPARYLARIRLRAACGLLIHTDLPIGEVARQCGYADQSYFAKRFSAHLRLRPLEYRRKYARKEDGPRRLG